MYLANTMYTVVFNSSINPIVKAVPSWAWKTDQEELADLSPLPRPLTFDSKPAPKDKSPVANTYKVPTVSEQITNKMGGQFCVTSTIKKETLRPYMCVCILRIDSKTTVKN